MFKTNILSAAAAVALMAGLSVPASAQQDRAGTWAEQKLRDATTAADAKKRLDEAGRYQKEQFAIAQQLAMETPYVNGSDGTKYKVTVTNKTTRTVWMTFYKHPEQTVGQAGTACIPPTKTITFAHSGWATSNGGNLRGELKSAGKCGGSTLQDKVLATPLQAPIVEGGTPLLVITHPSGNTNDMIGTVTR